MTYKYDEIEKKLIILDMNRNSIDANFVEDYYEKVRCIDLTNNKFQNFDSLVEFLDLKEIIMDNNFLSDKTEFPVKRFFSVKVLSLNNNKFLDLEKLMKNIAWTFPNLRYLSITGNPCCPIYALRLHRYDEDEYQNYRLFIISRLNKLQFLDAKIVSRMELQATKNSRRNSEEKPSPPQPLQSRNSIPKYMLIKKFFSLGSNENYNPLPAAEKAEDVVDHRGYYGRLRHRYNGSNSEGNRFILNNEL